MPKLHGYVTRDAVTHRNGKVVPVSIITTVARPHVDRTQTREVARRQRQAERQAQKRTA